MNRHGPWLAHPRATAQIETEIAMIGFNVLSMLLIYLIISMS